MSKFYTPLAIIVGAALVAVGLYAGLSHQGNTAGTQGTATPPSVNIKDVKTAGEPYIGQDNAPVVMAFWSDYQCPFCKAFEVGGVQGITTPAALPDLIKKYVDTGKLKIIFKDFPFLGNDSVTAGEYARSVWKLYPSQYFAWRTEMYKAQDQEGDQGFGNAATIDQLIKSKFPQMDDAKIAADVKANKSTYDQQLQADLQEGESMGITGTPAFIVGTTEIDGAQPLSTFTAAIDQELATASKN